MLSRLVSAHIKMLDQQSPVVRSHFAVMLLGYWIGGAIDAPLKHLGLFLEGRRLAHGQLTVIFESLRGGQAFLEAPGS